MIGSGIINRIRKEREVVGLFREHGACTPDLAVTPATLHREWTRYRPELNRLLGLGAVQRAAENQYYLDENRLMQVRMNRIKWALVALLIICLLAMGILVRKV